MKARGDLDRLEVNDVMVSIKRKMKEENLMDPYVVSWSLGRKLMSLSFILWLYSPRAYLRL